MDFHEQNIYDAATWSVFSPLSERSAAGKNHSWEFADFTRGGWKDTLALKLV